MPYLGHWPKGGAAEEKRMRKWGPWKAAGKSGGYDVGHAQPC